MNQRVLAGAAIGVIAAGVVILIIMFFGANTSKDYSVVLLLGWAGATMGALAGVILSSKQWAVFIPGVFVAGIFGCFLMAVALTVYSGIPWPAPHPYPGAQPVIQAGPSGTWGGSKTQTYEIDQPLSQVGSYFANQMASYCVDRWRFAPDNDCPKDAVCMIAECEIKRWGYEQYFEVKLIENTPGRTQVVQTDFWED